MKQYITQIGKVSEIQETYHVERKNKPDLYKKSFKFTSLDNQISFIEIRNDKIQLLDYINIDRNVKIEFFMQGSEKNEKKYNNIVCNSILNV